MSEKYSEKSSSKPRATTWLWLIVLPIWTYAAFWIAQLTVVAVQWLLAEFNLTAIGINKVVYVTAVSAIIYVLAILIVTGLPYIIWKRRTSSKELGVPDLPTWIDIVLPVPAFFVYLICSGILVLTISKLVPGINLEQAQQLPFNIYMLGTKWQMSLAFLALVIMTPIAEELLFRGYLHGKLRKVAPAWATVLITAFMFGVAHLWAGGESLQWAVAIDTFVLGIFLSTLREYTGAIWAGIILHAIKNGLAFYLLFVNPDIINQIKAAILPIL